jgi:hypothetical protein
VNHKRLLKRWVAISVGATAWLYVAAMLSIHIPGLDKLFYLLSCIYVVCWVYEYTQEER